jgi:site-specific recombinase XerD
MIKSTVMVPRTGTPGGMTAPTQYTRTTATPWTQAGTLLHAWCTTMGAENLAARTIAERPRIVARVSEELGVDVDAMAADDIERWLAELTRPTGGPASAGTRATYHGALKAWHVWLVRTGRRLDDPMAKLRTPRVPRRLPRPVATENLQRLLDSPMHRRTRVMVHLATYQGLRVHEVAKVRGEDVDLYAGTLTVQGKGGTVNTVPLHPVVAEDARRMPRQGWWFPTPDGDRPVRRDSVSAVISRAMARAGVDGTAHQLRHWYGTQLVRSGTDIRVAQTLMRHASLATTALYVAVDDGQQRDAVARLPVLAEGRRAA